MSPTRRSRSRIQSEDMLPGYRDAVEIGRGAVSIVYRAVEVATDRPVALKVLTADGTRRHLVDAFDAEGRALAAVSGHPHVVTLHRVATTPDGRPLLVLELCQGSYADQLRAGGPLLADRAVAAGIKIAGALETAHRAGILHLDVTPSNLLVTRYGEPALADFGVAAPAVATATVDGVIGFTTQHASPEVLEGAPVSPATDVYGLASTMYQLLTGRAPFAAFDGEAPASVILRILRDPVAPVRLPGVPIALSDLLADALAHDPADRPARAVDLADALRRIETAAGWAPPTVPVVWGEPPVGRTASTPAAVALGAPAPPDAPTTAPPPINPAPTAPPPGVPSPVAPAGDDGVRGERGPSVVQPEASPRTVAMPGPTGGDGGSTGPAGSGPLAPLQPVGPAGRPRLLVPPPPPPPTPPGTIAPEPRPAPAHAESASRAADTQRPGTERADTRPTDAQRPGTRPTDAQRPGPLRADARPTDARPTWALPTSGGDGPLQRTGIPELRPAPGPGRILGPPARPTTSRTGLAIAVGAGITVLVALALLLLLGVL